MTLRRFSARAIAACFAASSACCSAIRFITLRSAMKEQVGMVPARITSTILPIGQRSLLPMEKESTT